MIKIYYFNPMIYLIIQHIGLFLLLICLSRVTIAMPQTQETADEAIQKLYHKLQTKPTPLSKRLNQISAYFLNQPYENNSLGEGIHGKYDQFPLYRTDAFDCETYVDTVLAIALSDNLTEFKACINLIRYKNGQVAFMTRNHFTSLDWNTNNQQHGILKDITHQLKDTNHQ